MSKKLAIIHTTPVTIDVLKTLAKEIMPNYDLMNFLDDSILPQLKNNGGNLKDVEERWIQYALFAQQLGADGVLSACSSVGGLAAKAQRHVAVPVMRIDDAMAEEAIRLGDRIGVAATLPTTLNPTMELLKNKAEEIGKEISLEALLVEEAYERLMLGDKAGHDAILIERLGNFANTVDVVVLAQASMAQVLFSLSEAERKKFLSSPRLGMQRVHDILEGVS